MPFARRTSLALLAAAATLSLLQGFGPADDPDLAIVPAGTSAAYREPGEYLDRGRPVDAPRVTIRADRPIAIQRRQVTRAEYDACVADRGCRPLDAAGRPDRPAVGLSHVDATAYAAWKSLRTGRRWRLPSDREWALAAGSRWRDDATPAPGNGSNPADRWLAVYEAEAARGLDGDREPREAGAWGTNEHGLADLAGNVWEWTSTCYLRVRLEAGRSAAIENCGVRVAEGLHRAYMTSFIRDPKAGACSAGVPPANLGLRLVREERRLSDWLAF